MLTCLAERKKDRYVISHKATKIEIKKSEFWYIIWCLSYFLILVVIFIFHEINNIIFVLIVIIILIILVVLLSFILLLLLQFSRCLPSNKPLILLITNMNRYLIHLILSPSSSIILIITTVINAIHITAFRTATYSRGELIPFRFFKWLITLINIIPIITALPITLWINLLLFQCRKIACLLKCIDLLIQLLLLLPLPFNLPAYQYHHTDEHYNNTNDNPRNRTSCQRRCIDFIHLQYPIRLPFDNLIWILSLIILLN